MLGLVGTGSATACGGQNTVTPDITGTAQSAATIIASLPTAAALTPRPTRTLLPPTETSVPPTPVLAATTAPANVVGTPAATTAAEWMEYTVQAGDTLSSIAYAHKVSMAAIELLNDMDDSQVVRLGQVLRIPNGPTWPGENVFWFIYTVQSGEALSSIAAKFDVKIDDLVRINQLSDASAIRISQKLVIPTNVPTAPPEPATPVPSAKPRAEVNPEDTPVAEVAEVAPTPTEVALPEAPTEAPSQDAATQADAVTNVQADTPTDAQAAAAVVVVPDGDVEVFRAQLLALHNQERAAIGLPPLSPSPVLQQAAQLHAEDCASRGFCSHVGSDGQDTKTRVARAGYAGGTAGENWAWGHSAHKVFDAWFNQEYPSGPHRDNILSAHYSEVGFGIAAGSGGYYFVADFGAP
jgi:uncharacterized protein YkwD